jgi:RHS repeat-associated protein
MLAELGLTGSPGRFTYNGNEYDDEYGFDLYYYGARYMDPALGRFTTPDPVRDFINPYSYVRNNPINAVDPSGMAGSGFEYTNCTGYEFRHRGNPFWWLDYSVYLRWKQSNTSMAEIEWRNVQEDKKKYEAEYRKVRDLILDLKEKFSKMIENTDDPIDDKVLSLIEELLKGDNLYSMIAFVPQAYGLFPIEAVEAKFRGTSGEIILSLSMINASYTNVWMQKAILHELYHKADISDTSIELPGDDEIYAQEMGMRYWDRFDPIDDKAGQWTAKELHYESIRRIWRTVLPDYKNDFWEWMLGR